ncbi:EamA family transporter [Paenibacillus sp.]|uniref:EamA family transporter n=1 Tax=Paenibacillus sp. TaxID=58172 RepID=UPI002D2741B5|nr:EamA family transporter [Paenibacillus sp.]HZG85935.1 EamA family transporter [Paenibacillus sp.]
MLYAILAALCFGFRGILYHWTSQRGLDRNAMLCGVFATGMVISLLAGAASGQAWTRETLIGIVMGVCSFSANASLYKGFAVGKASIIAVLTALPAVVVVGLAYIFWGETLSLWQTVAFVVIVASLVMIRYSNDISLKNLQGAQWGVLAMVFFAFNDVAGKQSTLLGASMLPTLFFMFLTGSALFGASWWAETARRRAAGVPAVANRLGWGDGKVFLWGMVVGLTNLGGMVLILEAFARGVTGLVSAVVAMNIVLILVYTKVFVKVSFKRLELAGMTLAIAGILVLKALGG